MSPAILLSDICSLIEVSCSFWFLSWKLRLVCSKGANLFACCCLWLRCVLVNYIRALINVQLFHNLGFFLESRLFYCPLFIITDLFTHCFKPSRGQHNCIACEMLTWDARCWC